MSLFRIVYVSDAVGAAGEGLLPLIDIIGVSDRNNRRDHVTGMMTRHGGRFFQAVEGARVDLDRLMARLRADRRHANIRILADTCIERRLFSDWAMAQVEVFPILERLLAEDLNKAVAAVKIDQVLNGAHRTLAEAA